MHSQSSVPRKNSSEETVLFDDPIVAEVRQARERILESYGGDFEAMMRDMMKRQYETGHIVVSAAQVKGGVSGLLDPSSATDRIDARPVDDSAQFDDPIVAEVRQARRAILESYDGDLEAMFRDITKRQYDSGREIIEAKPRGVTRPHNPE